MRPKYQHTFEVLWCQPQYLDLLQRIICPTAVQSRLPDSSREVLPFPSTSEISGAFEETSLSGNIIDHQKEVDLLC
jgi:hypothetical protein